MTFMDSDNEICSTVLSQATSTYYDSIVENIHSPIHI